MPRARNKGVASSNGYCVIDFLTKKMSKIDEMEALCSIRTNRYFQGPIKRTPVKRKKVALMTSNLCLAIRRRAKSAHTGRSTKEWWNSVVLNYQTRNFTMLKCKLPRISFDAETTVSSSMTKSLKEILSDHFQPKKNRNNISKRQDILPSGDYFI